MIAEIHFKDDPEMIFVRGERLSIEVNLLTDSFFIKDLEKHAYIFYCEKNIIDYARIINEDVDKKLKEI